MNYAREEMISCLKSFFQEVNKFTLSEYSEKIPFDKYDVRVPLFGIKGLGKDHREVFVEVITEATVSKKEFFEDIERMDILSPGNKTPVHDLIRGVSPMHFYRYYFPWAKVYYALPEYAMEKEAYKEFETECKVNNIGLIKVSNPENGKDGVEIIFEPLSLARIWISELSVLLKTTKKVKLRV